MFFQKSRALRVLSVFNAELHWKPTDLAARATFGKTSMFVLLFGKLDTCFLFVTLQFITLKFMDVKLTDADLITFTTLK